MTFYKYPILVVALWDTILLATYVILLVVVAGIHNLGEYVTPDFESMLTSPSILGI